MRSIAQPPEITRAPLHDKQLIRNLLELYLHDLSEFDHADVNQVGQYDYPYLDLYWTETDRFPFIIRVEGKIAGFVLINRHFDPIQQELLWSVAEFFIMRKYRRKGIGTQVALHIFEKYRGKWVVAQLEDNLHARKFWRKVIGFYTQSNYTEAPAKDDDFQGINIYFDNTLAEEL